MKIKTTFKKVFLVFLFILSIFTLVSCGKGEEEGGGGDTKRIPTYEEKYGLTDFDTNDDNLRAKGTGIENAIVVFHYQRTSCDYKQWGLWVWQTDGERHEIAGYDQFGVYYKIDLSDQNKNYYHATTLGYIFFLPNWQAKDDYSGDRFLEIDETMLDENNEIHVYTFQGEKNLYMSSDKQHPVQVIDSAILGKDGKTITATTNTYAVKASVYENDTKIKEITVNKTNEIRIQLDSFHVDREYTVHVQFDEGGIEKTHKVNISNYFDTAEFSSTYTYNGDDLGVTVSNNQTTFKLWAPISSAVSVQIWDAGHPVSLGNQANPGDDEAISYNLTKGLKGVWSLTLNQNLYGKYYTYTVTNGSTVNENIVDPYAKAAGVNGLRGMILDFSTTNPTGWDYNYTRPYTSEELMIYELHVRDLTMHETWTGTEANRGKYLGLSEAGTTYTKNNVTVKTGFDHIKELGINAIQIQPFFDHANNELENTFNWGYNPQNYNVLEGQYSSNPYDGATRVIEFKQMIQAYREAGIEVIMDVVYNHVNDLGSHSFNKIVPGYFFRYTATGAISNGSGCGNETASERAMMRKYMIDSTEFWVKEYNLSGFRFDLMGLHDITTMNQLAANLHAIDSNIVVYGEPWTGGSTPLPSDQQATTINVYKLRGVGAFNDGIRDSIKGGVFAFNDKYYGGWIDEERTDEDLHLHSIEKSVNGKFFDAKYNGSVVSDYTKQINYVSCHDNHTLYDRLRIAIYNPGDGERPLFPESDSNTKTRLANADIAAQAIALAAKGTFFMLNGEEILRSKIVYDENGNPKPLYGNETADERAKKYIPTGVSHNSYNLPDKTNAIDWSLKVDNIEVFNAYKELIAIRGAHAILNDNVNATDFGTNYEAMLVTYTRENKTDTWSKAIAIYGNFYTDETLNLPAGNWNTAFIKNATITDGKIKLDNFAVVILYQE